MHLSYSVRIVQCSRQLNDRFFLIAAIDIGEQKKGDSSGRTTTNLKNVNEIGITSFIQPGKCDCCGESIDTAHTVHRNTHSTRTYISNEKYITGVF